MVTKLSPIIARMILFPVVIVLVTLTMMVVNAVAVVVVRRDGDAKCGIYDGAW